MDLLKMISELSEEKKNVERVIASLEELAVIKQNAFVYSFGHRCRKSMGAAERAEVRCYCVFEMPLSVSLRNISLGVVALCLRGQRPLSTASPSNRARWAASPAFAAYASPSRTF